MIEMTNEIFRIAVGQGRGLFNLFFWITFFFFTPLLHKFLPDKQDELGYIILSICLFVYVMEMWM